MKRAVFVAVAACTMCLSSNAETTFPSRQTILDFIARYEAPGGYDQVHSGTRSPDPRPLTRMTVGEVLDWQKLIRPRVTSTAAGRYQIIYKTLARLVDSYGIDPDLLFDAAIQDHLGELLLTECGYGQRETTAFADCLAQIWAALPRVTGASFDAFGPKWSKSLSFLRKFLYIKHHITRNTGSVIKWNADFFKVRTALGGARQRITISDPEAQ